MYVLHAAARGHARQGRGRKVKAQMPLDFVRERGTVHLRDVTRVFRTGR